MAYVRAQPQGLADRGRGSISCRKPVEPQCLFRPVRAFGWRQPATDWDASPKATLLRLCVAHCDWDPLLTR